MPNRYARDQLIKIALDMAQLPNLEVHDAPNGVVQSDAYSIQWLQDIIDFWYHMVPFSATVTAATLNATANQDYINLPSDFILDVRNGYLVRTVVGDSKSLRRCHRLPLQKFINRKLTRQRSSDNVIFPVFYCVQGQDSTTKVQRLQITPTPTVATVGQMYYYQLPAILTADAKPNFPNDYVCIEYIRIRALEWARVYEPGTAHKFCDKIVAGMKAAGLMNEPEDDEIPMDELVYHKGIDGLYSNTYVWMGPQ